MKVPTFLRRWIVPADELAVARATNERMAAQQAVLMRGTERAESEAKDLRVLLDTAGVIRERAGMHFDPRDRYRRHLRLDMAIDERMLHYAIDPYLVRESLAREAAHRIENAVLTLDFMLARDIAGVPR